MPPLPSSCWGHLSLSPPVVCPPHLRRRPPSSSGISVAMWLPNNLFPLPTMALASRALLSTFRQARSSFLSAATNSPRLSRQPTTVPTRSSASPATSSPSRRATRPTPWQPVAANQPSLKPTPQSSSHLVVDVLLGLALQLRRLLGLLDVAGLRDLDLLLFRRRLASLLLQRPVVALDVVFGHLSDLKLDEDVLPGGGSIVVHLLVQLGVHKLVLSPLAGSTHQHCMFIVSPSIYLFV